MARLHILVFTTYYS